MKKFERKWKDARENKNENEFNCSFTSFLFYDHFICLSEQENRLLKLFGYNLFVFIIGV